MLSQAAKLYGWDAQTNAPAPLNLTQVNVSQAKPDGTAKIIDVPSDD